MDKPKRGYLMEGMSFGEGTGGVDFSKGRSGAYSTADGDLMSGKDSGLGEFGRTNTKIGEYNEDTGEQRVYEGFKGGGVGQDIDRSNKGMDPYPQRKPGEGNWSFEQRVRKASQVDSGPNVESSIPAVDVSGGVGGTGGAGGGTGNFNDTDHGGDIGNYDSKASPMALKASRSKASWGGGSLSKRQKIRLGKGGRKAERQLARIERKAARKKKRGRSV